MPLESIQDAIQFQGLTEAKAKIVEWLTKVSESLETEGELKVSISQVAKHGEQHVMETIYSFDESMEEFIDGLLDEVCKDAEEIGRGKIKYSVSVKGVKGRCIFPITIPEREGEDEDDMDEVPNKRGLIGQQMRHTEALMKITVGFAKENQKTLAEQNKELRTRVRELEAARVETIKQYEELISMRHVRDLEFKKLDNSERRKDQVGHILMQLAPVLGAKFLGGGAKAAVELGAKTPLEVMIEGFLSTLNQETLMKLMGSGILSPVQMAGFKEIVTYILERQAASEAAAAAANGKAPPQASQPNGAPPPAQGPIDGEFVGTPGGA